MDGVLPGSMYVYLHTQPVLTAAKRANTSDPLGLELEMIVSSHVGAGDQISVLCKSKKCPEPLSQLSSLKHLNHRIA